MRPDTGHEALGPELFPQDAEHLFLHIHGDHGTGVADSSGKFAGEETGTAAEVKDADAGFHVPLCDEIGPVEKPPEAGVEVIGFLSGEDLVVRTPGFSGTGG